MAKLISRLFNAAHAGARAHLWGGLPLNRRARLKLFVGPSPITHGMHERSSLFVHIPKTGGTSITQALFSESPQSGAPYFVFERRNPAAFQAYFKFAFVRNPWDRLVSAYHYLRRSDLSLHDLAWVKAQMGEVASFDQFVRLWLNENRIWAHEVFAPQHFFVADAQDHIKVDFVGRFEKIHKDFETVCAKLNYQVDLQNLNQSSHPHYSTCYDKDTREIVAKLYARDIALFGYEFEAREPQQVPEELARP